MGRLQRLFPRPRRLVRGHGGSGGLDTVQRQPDRRQRVVQRQRPRRPAVADDQRRGSATSPYFCVDNTMSGLRFFAQQAEPGTDLRVQGVVQNPTGVTAVPLADLADGSMPSWAPGRSTSRTGRIPTGSSVMVALRFRAPVLGRQLADRRRLRRSVSRRLSVGDMIRGATSARHEHRSPTPTSRSRRPSGCSRAAGARANGARPSASWSSTLTAAGLFVVAAGALVLAGDAAGLRPGIAALLIAVYAVVARIEFPVGAGYVVPTQLILVPMLLMLPPAVVPVAVAHRAGSGTPSTGRWAACRPAASCRRCPMPGMRSARRSYWCWRDRR